MLEYIRDILESIKGFYAKVAYTSFPEGEKPKLPYICYYETDSANFRADNKVYMRISMVNIELYSKFKDVKSEELIEAKLNEECIPWDKSEDYIQSEKLYLVTYDIRIHKEEKDNG